MPHNDHKGWFNLGFYYPKMCLLTQQEYRYMTKESSLEMKLVGQKRKLFLHPLADPGRRKTCLAAWRKVFSYNGNRVANGTLSQLGQWKATTPETPRSIQWVLVSNSLPRLWTHVLHKGEILFSFLPACFWLIIASLFLASIPFLVLNLHILITKYPLLYVCW